MMPRSRSSSERNSVEQGGVNIQKKKTGQKRVDFSGRNMVEIGGFGAYSIRVELGRFASEYLGRSWNTWCDLG